MMMIHPLIRGIDTSILGLTLLLYDLSSPAMGRPFISQATCLYSRFIPSCEGQTDYSLNNQLLIAIHPLLRGADRGLLHYLQLDTDSSPLARGRLDLIHTRFVTARFIPSCEGQTAVFICSIDSLTIHPLLRGADSPGAGLFFLIYDSSPLARGRHSMFMRLSAALNTSLCNLHKYHFQLVTHHFLYL